MQDYLIKDKEKEIVTIRVTKKVRYQIKVIATIQNISMNDAIQNIINSYNLNK